MKTLLVLTILFTACIIAKCDDTNMFFITDEHPEVAYFSSKGGMMIQGRMIDPKIVEIAKTNRESLPASQFKDGNWGEVLDGFQLSLRFEKQFFTNGEPIVAILLLRNVTNINIWRSESPAGYSDGPIGFSVVSELKQSIPQHKYSIDVINVGQLPNLLFVQTQVKYVERLDKRFDLTNGTYSVQAVADGLIDFGGVSGRRIQVKSAKVKIEMRAFP